MCEKAVKDKILVFIPMYNCEKQIVRVLDQLKGDIAQYISEVIVVNNRSTDDGEAAVINKLSTEKFEIPIKLLRNDENYGLGGSHKVAFNYAIENGFDYVIVLHGDDQGSIENFKYILENKEFLNVDCILGGRFIKGSRLEGYSKFRTLGNKIFNIIFSICLKKRIYDLGAGLNMYSIKVLSSKYYIKYPDNLTFNCYMLFAMATYNQSYKFVPILWREEDQVSNVKMTKQAWQTFKMAIGYFFERKIFLQKDAREISRDSYTFKVIYDSNEGDI